MNSSIIHFVSRQGFSTMSTCAATTHTGRCTSPAIAASGHCSHHARLARVMALVPKSKPPTLVTSSSSVSSVDIPLSSPTPSPSSLDPPSFNSTPSRQHRFELLPGETEQHAITCAFIFPDALSLPQIPGTLYITSFRLRFEPQSSSLRGNGNFHRLLDTALIGLPRAAVAKLSYPPTTVATPRSLNGYTTTTPTRIVLKFKDLQSWTLGGDVTRLLPVLNRYVFIKSPMHLFAFTGIGPTNDDLQGHTLYNLEADFARMGVALRDPSSAFRVTEVNTNFTMCPTYPRHLVVPAAASDSEVEAVASYRSKGRLPICSYVHARNGAALWRCAQPQRGILHAQSSADEQYLLHIARASNNAIAASPTRRIWIADCRPELNARVNNFTGGGTESGNLAHARVTFLNIGNIHAMRESLEAVRGLGGFLASTLHTQAMDFAWSSRVDDTKWLSHVRRVLSGALEVARAVEAKATTVVVHCSDGWDRTAQLCGLAQLLIDAHYRTRRGFLEVVEKEWVRAGHKFQERVAPGIDEDDDDQQAPIFLQFLDCVWQLVRVYPTYFEFNARMLETMADALFSGQYGTFLGNCERERAAWSVRERTPSLYTCLLQDDRFVNPFFRASSTQALVPYAPAILRQVTLWTSYYFRGAPFSAIPTGNPTPPLYADVYEDGGSRDGQEDMENAMTAALRRIQELEDALRAATSSPSSPRLAPMSYPPLYAKGQMLSSSMNDSNRSNTFQDDSATSNTMHAACMPLAASIQALAPAATWTCSVCTKTNVAEVLQCIVCGRAPR
ncbi:hypothetical protein CCR75_000568 [Bremia lactucae]|uniref:Phosphatidylinositol-3-phosphatase n=1 Tax=Bremia lactucae TaxID=4779 RepID=A0A976IK22_BRELC|nr:hypothetical protein CCR75_000568 [Bremia lactucae]